MKPLYNYLSKWKVLFTLTCFCLYKYVCVYLCGWVCTCIVYRYECTLICKFLCINLHGHVCICMSRDGVSTRQAGAITHVGSIGIVKSQNFYVSFCISESWLAVNRQLLSLASATPSACCRHHTLYSMSLHRSYWLLSPARGCDHLYLF